MAAYSGNTSLWRHISASSKESRADIIKRTSATATVSLEDLQRRFWQMNIARRESAIQRMQSDGESQPDLRRKIPDKPRSSTLRRPEALQEDPIEQFSPPRREFCMHYNPRGASNSSAAGEQRHRGAPDALVLPIAEE